jgi:RHS repeat-associated protein
MQKPDGTIVYTPFPTYEAEVSEAEGTTIIRSTYSLADQMMAVRVSGDPVSGNNGLFYYHTDHLGSAHILTRDAGGSVLTASLARYYPYGGFRTAPTATQTDRGFTGHRHNNLGNNDLGLIYMNARYYLPGIGRFVSADTIVPDPTNPQSFNRYSYGLNNPVKYTDPTGHRPTDGCEYEGCDLDDDLDPDKTWGEPDGTLVESLTETDVNPVSATGPTTPYRTRLTVDSKEIGWLYYMPAGSAQSTVSVNSTRYKIGRFLAGSGIAIDVVELVLSVVPGASVGPGYTDSLVTYFAGALTGDNYLPFGSAPPPGLPSRMVSINQDAIVNGVEAFLPTISAGAFGVSGILAGAVTALPGDELIYGGGLALMGYQMVDATTSTISAFYDYGRFNGTFQNHYTIGYALGYGVIIINW